MEYDDKNDIEWDYLNLADNSAEFNNLDVEIGTCQGCGKYGQAGTIHIKNGEECGEYL